MMARINKGTRDEAILICAIAASTPELTCMYFTVALYLGWAKHRDALELAQSAWGASVEARPTEEALAVVDALAAQMLREGWSPK